MTFTDIPQGVSVFLDANTFVYHFAPGSKFGPACSNLLDRVQHSGIMGFTSSDVLSDVAHRLMTYEAADLFGWPMSGIVYKLQQQPDKIRTLTKFRQAIENIPKFGVRIFTVDASHVVAATSMSQQFGLLSGDALIDALIAAVMQAHNLTSNDADFDRVPWITRFAAE